MNAIFKFPVTRSKSGLAVKSVLNVASQGI